MVKGDEMTPDRSRMAARDRFLEGDGPDPSVRPEISASWRRSRLSGVTPDRLPEPPASAIDLDSRLVRAARPVLERMAVDIGDTALSVMLTDGGARILERRVGVAGLRTALDAVGAVPGAGLSEERVGTNGVGTCIELRSPVIVTGGEHFVSPFVRLACAGAPILHPVTGRLEGVLDITAPAEDATGLMLAYVRGAAAGIGRRLEELASRAERALFDAFRSAAGRSSGPVVTMNAEVVIANAAASRLLDPSDHLVMWQQLADVVSGRAMASEVRLDSGATYRTDVIPVTVDDRTVGAVLRLRDGAPRRAPSRRTRRAPPALDGLVGSAPPWQALCREVVVAGRSSLDVLVTGPEGSGKLAVARALHGQGDPPRPVEVVDVATDDWLDRLSDVIGRPVGVVVRHLDLVPADRAPALAALLERTTAPIVATATSTWPDTAPRALLDRFAVHLVVPSLRERRDDIPLVVAELLRRHGDGGAVPRVSPEAMRALAAHDWPGDVRQLEGVIRQALARRRGDITVDDLPVEQRGAPDVALTAMQRLERDAILRSLDEAGGNRAAAAEHLGISRSTLYRRLAAYGVS
jgi:sigma-54 dependent transcriptional regulator, acetoin dehydrogenase operon transcriptional activator AcoR